MKDRRPAEPLAGVSQSPGRPTASDSESLPPSGNKPPNACGSFASAAADGSFLPAVSGENSANAEIPSSAVEGSTYKPPMSDAFMPQPWNTVAAPPASSEWSVGVAEPSRVRTDPANAVRADTESKHPLALPVSPAADRFGELMAAVATRRDRAAFAVLFDHFAPRVKAYTLRHGCDTATAEELAQDVMLTVWRRAASFDDRQATVCTWIFIIARNRCIDWLRRVQRPATLLAEAELLAPKALAADDGIAEAEREAELRAAVMALPRAEADLLRLAYFEGKTHCQIADACRLPLGTVKTRLRRALSRLRRTLKDGE